MELVDTMIAATIIQLARLAASLSSIFGLLGLIAFFTYALTRRVAVKSIETIIGDPKAYTGREVSDILSRFDNDNARIEALKGILAKDQTTAQELYSKVKGDADVQNLMSLNFVAHHSRLVLALSVFLLLGGLGVLYTSTERTSMPVADTEADTPPEADTLAPEPVATARAALPSFCESGSSPPRNCADTQETDPTITDLWSIFERSNESLMGAIRDSLGASDARIYVAFGPAGVGKTSYFKYAHKGEAKGGFRNIEASRFLAKSPMEQKGKSLKFADLKDWVCSRKPPMDCGDMGKVSPGKIPPEYVVSPSLLATSSSGTKIVSYAWGDQKSAARGMMKLLKRWNPASEVLILDSLDELHSSARETVALALKKHFKGKRRGAVFILAREEVADETIAQLMGEENAHIARIRVGQAEIRNESEIRIRYQNLYEFRLKKNALQSAATVDDVVGLLKERPDLCGVFGNLTVSEQIIDLAHVKSDSDLDWHQYVGEELMRRAQRTHGRPARGDAGAPQYIESIRAAIRAMDYIGESRLRVRYEAPTVPYGDGYEIDVVSLLNLSGLVQPDPQNRNVYWFKPEWLISKYFMKAECEPKSAFSSATASRRPGG